MLDRLNRDTLFYILDCFLNQSHRLTISLLSKQFRKLILQYELERLPVLRSSDQTVMLIRIAAHLAAKDQLQTNLLPHVKAYKEATISINDVLNDQNYVLHKIKNYLNNVIIPPFNVAIALAYVNRVSSLSDAERAQYAAALKQLDWQGRPLLQNSLVAMQIPRTTTLGQLCDFFYNPLNSHYNGRTTTAFCGMVVGQVITIRHNAHESTLFKIVKLEFGNNYGYGLLAFILREDLTNYTREKLQEDYDRYVEYTQNNVLSIHKYDVIHEKKLCSHQAFALLPLLVAEIKSYPETNFGDLLDHLLTRIDAHQAKQALDILVSSTCGATYATKLAIYPHLLKLTYKVPELLNTVTTLINMLKNPLTISEVTSAWIDAYHQHDEQTRLTFLFEFLMSSIHKNHDLIKIKNIPSNYVKQALYQSLAVFQKQINLNKYLIVIPLLIRRLDEKDSLEMFDHILLLFNNNDNSPDICYLKWMECLTNNLAADTAITCAKKLLDKMKRCHNLSPPSIDFLKKILINSTAYSLSTVSNGFFELAMTNCTDSGLVQQSVVLNIVELAILLDHDFKQFLIPLIIKFVLTDTKQASDLLSNMDVSAYDNKVDWVHKSFNENSSFGSLVKALIDDNNIPLLRCIFPLLKILDTKYRDQHNTAFIDTLLTHYFTCTLIPPDLLLSNIDWYLHHCNQVGYGISSINDLFFNLTMHFEQSPHLVSQYSMDLLNNPLLFDLLRKSETGFISILCSLKNYAEKLTGNNYNLIVSIINLIANKCILLPAVKHFQVAHILPYLKPKNVRVLLDKFKKELASQTSVTNISNALCGIVSLRSRIAAELIIPDLMRYITTSFTAVELIIQFVTDLTDEQINLLFSNFIESPTRHHCIRNLIPKLNIANIERLVSMLNRNLAHPEKIITVLLSRLIQLQRNDLIAHLALSPSTNSMFAYPFSDMTPLMPKVNVDLGLFVTCYVDQQHHRYRGNDPDSMIAVMVELTKQMFAARLSKTNINELVKEFCNLVLTGPHACLLLIAASQVPLLAKNLKNIALSIVSELAELNHPQARYAIVSLIEHNQEGAINYVTAYCDAVTDVARIRELKASLETFYRQSRPQSATFFTESQIPKPILTIISTALQNSSLLKYKHPTPNC